MGTYKKIEIIGNGRSGDVWRAEHIELRQECAVKYINIAAADDSYQDLYHEAQAMKKLEHPNIVRVFDAGKQSSKQIYIAMELEKRGSLKELIAKEGRQKLTDFESVFCGVLKALAYAHRMSYLHQDIKPANIMLGEHGEGKLTDLGLSTKAKDKWVAGGTPAYSAPEKLIMNKSTVASDIYAVGVSMYEAVCGQLEDPAIGKIEFMQAVSNGKFPNRDSYPLYVPNKFKNLINRAMDSKSSRRFKSADELRSAVEQVPIKCSWQESKGQNLSSWESEGLAKEIRVSVEVKKGKYRLRVSQSSSSGAPFRAITKLCRSGLNQKEALAAVGHVTRSLISGKRIPDIELKPSKTMK